MVRHSLIVVLVQCSLSVIVVQGVCRLHAGWVVVPFRAGEYSVIGCCVKSCGGCRCGTVRAWCSPLAVGLRSSLIRLCGARRRQWVFVASVPPAFLRYVFKLLFQCFSCKAFLSCCTTRAMAIGVTERNRRCVHLIVGVGVKTVCFRYIHVVWISLCPWICSVWRTCFVSAYHVSHELFSALLLQHDVRCCVAFPAAVVHGLWCRHCDQGVETSEKLPGHPRVVPPCGAELSVG